MTEDLFRHDAYLRGCEARVVSAAADTLVLDRTVFYPLGGGQPGDTGRIWWQGGCLDVLDTRYGEGGTIRHLFSGQAELPAVGETVRAEIDWERRYRHMRMHTAMHLLGSLLPFGVTGGNISAERSRLDFDMQESADKELLGRELARLVEEDHPVSCRWISEEDLASQPDLVRTLSVCPPKGAGKIRLLEIEGVDLQPCGGTHLKSTIEVGKVRIGKIENKGRHNRRFNIFLDD